MIQILDLIIIVLILCIFVKLYLTPNKNNNENFGDGSNSDVEVLLVTDNYGLMYRGRLYNFTGINEGNYFVRLNNTTNICNGVALIKYNDRLYVLNKTNLDYAWYDISDILVAGTLLNPVNNMVILDNILTNSIKVKDANTKLVDVLSNLSLKSLLDDPLRVSVNDKTYCLLDNKLCILPDNKRKILTYKNNNLNLKALFYDYNNKCLNCLDDNNKLYAIDNNLNNIKLLDNNATNISNIVNTYYNRKVVLDLTKIVVDKELIMVGYNENRYLSIDNILYKLENNKILMYTNDNVKVYNYQYDLLALLYIDNVLYVKDVNNYWYKLGIIEPLKPYHCTNLNTHLLNLLTNRNKLQYINNLN